MFPWSTECFDQDFMDDDDCQHTTTYCVNDLFFGPLNVNIQCSIWDSKHQTLTSVFQMRVYVQFTLSFSFIFYSFR